MFKPRHQTAIFLFLVIFMLDSGCVYYNNFFQAKKKFNEAEKSQKENVERQSQAQIPTPATPGGQRQQGAPSQKTEPAGQTGPLVNMQEQTLYRDAIDKANKVLLYHPTSKWVDDALWLMGKSYFNMGDYLLADRRFKELVTNHPKSKFADESYYYMGLCQVYLGHNDQALSAFASLEDVDKKSPYIEDMLFAKGAMEMMAQNYAQAGELFAEYTAKFPDGDSAARATFNLGYCREKQNDFGAAYSAYIAVDKRNPGRLLYFDATLAAATAAIKSDSVELGMNILDKLAKDERYFARSGEILLRVAEGHYLQGNIDKAVETYQSVITSNPQTPLSAEAYYKLGLINQNNKFDLGAAKEAFSKAQQEAPNSVYKNLALARSAQIAKLESYQAQLQRADSLREADEMKASGHDVGQTAVAETLSISVNADTIQSSSDSISADSIADSSAVSQKSEAIIDTIPPPQFSTDSTAFAIVDTGAVAMGNIPESLLQRSDLLPKSQTPDLDDSLRVSRMLKLLGADLSIDTAASARQTPVDSVLHADNDSLAKSLQSSGPPADANHSSGQPAVNEDSIRTAILQSGIETRYLLAELYAYELSRPDSAIYEYLLIAKEHPQSPYAPKSLLAAAQVELNRKDTVAAMRYLNRVIDEYPDSPQAARAAEITNSPLNMQANAMGLYVSAESLAYSGNNPDSAIALFKFIADKYPDLAPKASLAEAWVLDQIIGVEDSSAYFAYLSVAQKYPETAYAQAANERLGLTAAQGGRKHPPKPTQQPQSEQQPDENVTADTSGQLMAGDLPLAPQPKKVGDFLYPESLLSKDLKGKVIFKIRIDFSGKVAEHEIIGPSGEYAIDSVATQALINTEFDTSQLSLSQLDGYFQYSIPFSRPNINIYNDPYRDLHEEGR
jgi:TolA-binding protein